MNFEQFAQSIAPAATTVTDVAAAATTPMWSTAADREAQAVQAAAVAEREARLAAYDPHQDPKNPFRHLLPAPGSAPAQTPAPTAYAEAVPTGTTPDQLRRIAETLRQQAHDLDSTAARIEAGN